MRIGRSIQAAIAAHALLTITHGGVTDLADQTDIATHAAHNTGVHGVGAGYVALGAHAAMPAVDRGGDANLGTTFRRASDDNYITLIGGTGFSAQIELYGVNHASEAGVVKLMVPNAAGNARVPCCEWEGRSDTPEMVTGRVPRARIPDWNHAGTHEDTGADEISVGGLSGLLADDQNPVAHGFADHTNRVRTLPLIPFVHGTGVMVSTGLGWGYELSTPTFFGRANFEIPTGFVSFISASVWICPITNGNFDWTCNAEQVNGGEAFGTDTDTTTADGQVGVNFQMLELVVTAALDGLTLAPGDWVGVELILDALDTMTAIRLCGLSVSLEMDE